jgi:hypothetical protein
MIRLIVIGALLLAFIAREDVRRSNTKAYDMTVLQRYGHVALEESRRAPGRFLAAEWSRFLASLVH